ncbi:MAG: PaaI family thioesterase, partial [Gammaproteobacteria bacterium]
RLKTGMIMGLLRFIANLKFLSEARRLELYPPFFKMHVKVLEMRDNWRHVRLRLPLTAFSSNLSGDMFGGWQAALADPIAALACARVFPGYSVWTRAMNLDYRKGGRTDLELRFDMNPEQETAIRAELTANDRATPTFEYGYYLTDGSLCTLVRNTVAIRPKGYVKSEPEQLDLNKV